MSGFIFIAALGVSIAVIGWYVANEAKGGDGAFGLFALKDDTTAKTADPSAPKYRKKKRATPARRGGSSPEKSEKAYRPKRAERASWRFDTGDENSADE